MAEGHFGELVPVGGGDAIPLVSKVMTIGRRESCDICLKFQNISGTHCELALKNGVWHLRDLNSTNGVKVNGERTLRRPLRPGDEIGIAARRYVIQYQLAAGTKIESRPLAPARRKAETLRFARRAARRLSAQIDPSLGDDR